MSEDITKGWRNIPCVMTATTMTRRNITHGECNAWELREILRTGATLAKTSTGNFKYFRL
jgi:hypothetical protein